MIAKRN